MNNYLISVIVSCYNSEKTIDRTLLSILNNTYKNLEVIVVNDCSTDNSVEVAQSFNDSRIKIVNHKINKGAGWARDTGVKNATGDFISFVDSDDWISEDYYESLLKAHEENNSDITYAKLIPIVNGVEDTPYYHDNGPFEGVDKITHTMVGLYFLNNGLIKKSLFDTIDYNHSRFIEDTPTMMKLHYLANKIVYTNSGAYYYPQNEGSLIHSADNKKYRFFKILAMIDSYEYFKDKEPYNEIFSPQSIICEMLSLIDIDTNHECIKKYPEEFNRIRDFIKASIKTT